MIEHWMDVYARSPNKGDRIFAAMSPETRPETLARLATDNEVAVRCEVAANPNTPPDTLAQLTSQPWPVEYEAAYNTSTPPAARLRYWFPDADFTGYDEEALRVGFDLIDANGGWKGTLEEFFALLDFLGEKR